MALPDEDMLGQITFQVVQVLQALWYVVGSALGVLQLQHLQGDEGGQLPELRVEQRVVVENQRLQVDEAAQLRWQPRERTSINGG